MDNSCIIGYGIVGKATAMLFGIKKHFSRSESNITLEEAAKCRYVFICLPTPVNQDGSYDTKAIEDIIKQIEGYGGAGIYILRSTVWPGFANHFMGQLGINRIISNPEFLSEDTWEKDTKSPPFILLGGIQNDFLEDVKGLYESRIKSAPVILTDNTTAEMAKISLNAYFATKVIFANQTFDAAQRIGANYERVKEIMEKHPFGPKNHFVVWYKGKRGIHGRCLPKDSQAFAHYTNSELVKKVIELNSIYENLTLQ